MRLLLATATALALGLLLSCGQARRCDSGTCSGCCDAQGECQLGGSTLACGSGGIQCQPCAQGQSCTLGQCLGTSSGTGGGGGATGGGGGSTGGGGGGANCNATNCGGCCDGNTCVAGTSNATCGANGASCISCGSGLSCQGTGTGRACLATGTGGGGGSSGGGGGSTGGGGGSTGGGGGSIGGGGGSTGGGGGSAGCGPTNCNGCCSSTGTCITQTTAARCGLRGDQCQSCLSGSTCVGGSCQPCNGCVNPSTGQCESGTTNSLCGRFGNFCNACDTGAGQTCQSGVCGGGTTCNATSCANGCCDGNTCVQASSFTTSQCGQGSGGAACVACTGGATCDSAQRRCVTSDAGFPGDAGLPFLCDLSTPCPSGQCCDSFLAFGICVEALQACSLTGGVCNPLTEQCQ